MNKKIGVSFKFDKYDKHFIIIFKDIDLNKYIWHVTNSEIIYYNEEIKRADTGVLEPNVYNGEKFLKQINSFPYYVISTRLFATSVGNTIKPEEITDYNAFYNSNCEIALLCADSYVDFYAKDESVIDAVAESCKKHYNCDVMFITKENDMRTGFYI